MPKSTRGPTVKARVKCLLEALLNFADEKPGGIECRWEYTILPKLIVKTKLRIIESLLHNDDRHPKLTKVEIREALRHMKDTLEILEDHRVQQRGSDNWHFTLTLWSTNKVKNLKQFELVWEQKRPDKSKQQEETLKNTGNLVNSLPPQQLFITANVTKLDWGEAPYASHFYGREDELSTLKHWILAEKSRLIALFGMGGIGKTSVAIKLGQQIAETKKFTHIIWRSLRESPQIETIVTELIKFLSNQEESNLPKSISEKISRLIFYLQSSPCLVFFDNVESILQGQSYTGSFRKGYEEYGELLKRLGQSDHESCVVLTSREKPREIATLEGNTKPIKSLQLTGLNFLDAREIFIQRGHFSGSEHDWNMIIDHYAGNPLALSIVASLIQDGLNGDLSQFVKNYLTQNKVLFVDIGDILTQQFDRLSYSEREIMYWLAMGASHFLFSAQRLIH